MDSTDSFGDMAVARDGSVYVTGGREASTRGATVLKLDPTGRRDPAYGNAGVVALAAHSPAVDAAGSLYVISGMSVAKLDPEGRLDLSFGINGHSDPSIFTDSSRLDRLVRDSDGNLYVASMSRREGVVNVTKLDVQGRVVGSFGASGTASSPAVGFSAAHAMAFDSDGNLAIVGPLFFTGTSSPARARIFKVDRNSGAPVAGFGTGGVAGEWSCEGIFLPALAQAPSGDLVAGGLCRHTGSLLRATTQKVDRAGRLVASYRDGGFDTFGTTQVGGLLVESHEVSALLPHAGGHYVAGHRRGSTCTQGGVAKLDNAGQYVTSFGSNGIVTFDGLERVAAIGADAAGRLYLGGHRSSTCPGVGRFVVYRLGG